MFGANRPPGNIYECGDVALIGYQAVQDIVKMLNRLHTHYDAETVMDRGRIAIRVVGAICSPEEFSPGLIARLVGVHGAVTPNRFCTMLTAAGEWAGETGVEMMRAFLMSSMCDGEHPRDIAAHISMSADEFHTINHLLGFEDRWNSTKRERAAIAALSGATLKEIRRIGRCGRWEARRWRSWATRLRQELTQQSE